MTNKTPSALSLQPSAIVDVARTLINTPYAHQGRVAQGELDCIGVVIKTAQIAGLMRKDFDFRHYSRFADGSLERELGKLCQELDTLTNGAIVTIDAENTGKPHHCGIITKAEVVRLRAEGTKHRTTDSDTEFTLARVNGKKNVITSAFSPQPSAFNLIHAYQNAGRVTEHELIPFWRDKIVKIYGFPGVDYGN